MGWNVAVYEYERGWGSKLDSVYTFDTYEQAKQYQTEYNSKNNEKVVPDWYMVAKEPYRTP